MAKHCEICGKAPIKAAKLKVNMNGTVKRINVCTSCLRAGKVQKAV